MRIRFALLLLLAACGSVQSAPSDGAPPPVIDGAPPPVIDGALPSPDAAVAGGAPEMDVQTILAGAGRMTGGTLTLDVAVGQPIVPNTASGGTVTLGGATP